MNCFDLGENSSRKIVLGIGLIFLLQFLAPRSIIIKVIDAPPRQRWAVTTEPKHLLLPSKQLIWNFSQKARNLRLPIHCQLGMAQSTLCCPAGLRSQLSVKFFFPIIEGLLPTTRLWSRKNWLWGQSPHNPQRRRCIIHPSVSEISSCQWMDTF